jgi:beta-glucosidase/6-phospho-beta-glucosidase/beta-galactosidase
VTLVHNDLPQWVQDEGGFLNSNVIKYFKLYADEVFKQLGSRVKMWITFNEPFDACVEGYGTGTSAPLIRASGIGEYSCSYNLLLAHATAYHLYKDKYAADQRGMIGITLDGRFYYPKDSSVSDNVIQRAMNFDVGWFSNPIFSKIGGYPQVMIDEVNERSMREGRPWSRLPVMDEDTKNFIRGSADFLGYNYYSSRLVQLNSSDYDPEATPSLSSDSRMLFFTNPKWKRAKSTWLYSVPEGLRDALVWFKKEYENPTILITENGWSDDGELEDDGRIDYLKSHLTSISKAINEDGCNVIGYTAWSIIDNFEWLRGYTEHFGIYSVNLTSPTKERTAKKSAGFLKKLIKNGLLFDD